MSDLHGMSTTETRSYKTSTSVSALTPTSPQPDFAGLIETEKPTRQPDEFRVSPNLTDDPVTTNQHKSQDDPPIEYEYESDTRDEVECDYEIHRITNGAEAGASVPNNPVSDTSDVQRSPEPSGNDEIDKLRDETVHFQEFEFDEHVRVSLKTSSRTMESKSVSEQHVSSMTTAQNQLLESSESQQSTKKSGGTKVERKTSKAGGKKTKSNAEISKENISVPLVPEDLAKKLGPGESRVFAKVCVANLRRSFGDLTVIESAQQQEQSPPTENGVAVEYHGFSKFGSTVTERSRPFGSGGPSSLPSVVCTTNNPKLQLFQYWHQLLSSSQKSSFSKFDNLAKKNERKAEEQTQQQLIKKEDEGTKQEKKVCASCEKQVFQMELIRAEKKDWHKNCFRCSTCRKVLSVDTYQSHEQNLYCKPHFKELFQPKQVMDDEQSPSPHHNAASPSKPKLQLIICESQPKELPPDVVRASDTPSTGLEDIQIDVRSKFELFEKYKENNESTNRAEAAAPTKRSASVLAKLKKYETSMNGAGDLKNGVSDEDIHGVDHIQMQSDEEEEEEEEEEDEEGNSVIKSEIKRKLKNPLQVMNEIAHFKQMEAVRSKWEDGAMSSRDNATDQRKEELQKFRSRLCQGKSNQLKEMYEKALEGGENSASSARVQEIEELKSERARTFREMFEKGEVKRSDDEEDEGEEGRGGSRPKSGGVDLEVFEAGVARESRSLFEKLDKRVGMEKSDVVRAPAVRNPGQGSFVKQAVQAVTSPGADVVRCLDKVEDSVKVNTAELSNKFKFFETYENELERRAKDAKGGLKRFTPPRDDSCVKTDKDYDESSDTYRDPEVVRHGEPAPEQDDDTLQKSKTTSKMLNIFRQMEENMSKDGAKDPIIRPMKQFTPPRDTVPRVYDENSDEEEEDEEEEEEEDEAEEEQEQDAEENKQMTEDEFLKEVGSLARARSLRAKFERWEQQENERNKTSVGGADQESLADSIESARNLKAKFEAMRLLDNNKENKGASPVPLRINRFVLNTQNDLSRDFPDSQTSGHLQNHHGTNGTATSLPPTLNADLIMSSNEQCALCEKRVYVMEKIEAGGKMYHKNCFRCSQCKSILRMDTFTSNKGTLFCTTHFKQLFKIKGNYDEGFGHESQYQVWAKKQAAAAQPN